MRNRVKSIVKIQKFNSKVLKEEEAVKFEDSGEKEEIKSIFFFSIFPLFIILFI